MLADGTMVDVDNLPENLVHTESRPDPSADNPSVLEEQERHLLEEALRASGGNQSEAARRLGIGRDALRYKMKRYDLSS